MRTEDHLGRLVSRRRDRRERVVDAARDQFQEPWRVVPRADGDELDVRSERLARATHVLFRRHGRGVRREHDADHFVEALVAEGGGRLFEHR